MIGGFGNAEIFSFHATKFLNTFEGGAVVTNDDDLAEKIRLMKNFGFARLDNVIHLGTNGKMDEMAAAMGVVSLESLDAFIEINRRNFEAYRDCLSGIPGITLVLYDINERGNYQYIILEINAEETGISRDGLMKILHAENIRARRYFYPGCHRMEPYRSFYPNAGLLLPETEKLSERVLCLPTGTTVNARDIQNICGIIRFVIEHSAEIGVRLTSVSEI
jgi:dTDP-4-amino-4,6-dideoxygalactose transaminase